MLYILSIHMEIRFKTYSYILGEEKIKQFCPMVLLLWLNPLGFSIPDIFIHTSGLKMGSSLVIEVIASVYLFETSA